jgi:hypothetical protein
MITDHLRVACPVAVVIMLPPVVPGHAGWRGRPVGVVLRKTTTITGNDLLVFCCIRRLGPVPTAAFAVASSEDVPSIGTDGELPAGDEEAIFKHHGLAYEPGGGERRLARR